MSSSRLRPWFCVKCGHVLQQPVVDAAGTVHLGPLRPVCGGVAPCSSRGGHSWIELPYGAAAFSSVQNSRRGAETARCCPTTDHQLTEGAGRSRRGFHTFRERMLASIIEGESWRVEHALSRSVETSSAVGRRRAPERNRQQLSEFVTAGTNVACGDSTSAARTDLSDGEVGHHPNLRHDSFVEPTRNTYPRRVDSSHRRSVPDSKIHLLKSFGCDRQHSTPLLESAGSEFNEQNFQSYHHSAPGGLVEDTALTSAFACSVLDADGEVNRAFGVPRREVQEFRSEPESALSEFPTSGGCDAEDNCMPQLHNLVDEDEPVTRRRAPMVPGLKLPSSRSPTSESSFDPEFRNDTWAAQRPDAYAGECGFFAGLLTSYRSLQRQVVTGGFCVRNSLLATMGFAADPALAHLRYRQQYTARKHNTLP